MLKRCAQTNYRSRASETFIQPICILGFRTTLFNPDITVPSIKIQIGENCATICIAYPYHGN